MWPIDPLADVIFQLPAMYIDVKWLMLLPLLYFGIRYTTWPVGY